MVYFTLVVLNQIEPPISSTNSIQDQSSRFVNLLVSGSILKLPQSSRFRIKSHLTSHITFQERLNLALRTPFVSLDLVVVDRSNTRSSVRTLGQAF
ncbi:hypothetical protein PGT21_019308 [Puccinia graminis f. sp. tritici]|uniref:Uncharacterized protein n=1 Tax=Puccinia graminis f. sp. tritici TaxID=56615 RepID=A0A5B0PY51_PUCGR|nr:hypothetical protein PGT21_019308 [Puccinia graminis f. sp. tritici]